MNHSQLRAFHQVALHGGFSRAAQAMGLTQPAVSDQVLNLERAYDVLLFDRRKKQVALTEKGEELAAITRTMFEVEAQAEELLSHNRALSFGNLSIIADSAHYVTGILARFRAKYPGVHIALRSGNSAEVETELSTYNADIGVLGSTPNDRLFHGVDLGGARIVAFAARSNQKRPASGVSLQDLTKYTLVFREQGSRTRQKLEQAAKMAGINLVPSIEAEGREAVREIVAAGDGIGFVSEAEFGRDQRLVKIPISGAALQMQETLICLHQRRDVRTIRAFMEIGES